MGNKGRIILRSAGILLLASGVLSFCLAYREHRPFAEAEVRDRAVKQAVVTDSPSDPLERRIDFDALGEINPDIIGWLYAPQIGVDSPILRGSGDGEYLAKDFEGNPSPLGSIFTWAHADRGLMGQHVCLFGHNMPSGQMFGNLKRFQEPGFVEKNGTLYLYTPEHSKKLEVTDVYECGMDDDIFQDGWGGGADRQTVTLATCVGYSRTPYRLAVNCEVVETKLLL